MILVDSSVWIDFIHARETPQTNLLRRDLLIRRWGTPDLVLTEVLQGARSERAATDTERMLRTTEIVEIVDEVVAVEAARHYRTLRVRGFTPRKTIDTLIATRCIAEGWTLLHHDRDFAPFEAHLGLRSVVPVE